MLLAAKASYNPEAAISVFERFERLHSNDKSAPPAFAKYISTHPSDRERIEKMRSWLPEARRILQTSGVDAHLM